MLNLESGFIFVNFIRKSGSSSRFDLNLFLIASIAEKRVSHRYNVLNGIKNVNDYRGLIFKINMVKMLNFKLYNL